MNRIKLHDKEFELSIPEKTIKENVKAVAERINKDYEGRCPIILSVLNGSFIFCADLVRELTIPCEISFVKLSSYAGTSTTGKVREILGINTNVENRDVIIVEDIIESGFTMQCMKEILRAYNVSSAKICTLFFKPSKLQCELEVDYPAMVIPDDFIVGYGLDYNDLGRNLKDVYTLSSDNKEI